MRRMPGALPAAVATTVATVSSALMFVASADASVAAGALQCSLPVYNPTKYALKVAPMPQTVTCKIIGASDASGLTSVPVIIKSSTNGNTTVTGTVAGGGSSTKITFTY